MFIYCNILFVSTKVFSVIHATLSADIVMLFKTLNELSDDLATICASCHVQMLPNADQNLCFVTTSSIDGLLQFEISIRKFLSQLTTTEPLCADDDDDAFSSGNADDLANVELVECASDTTEINSGLLVDDLIESTVDDDVRPKQRRKKRKRVHVEVDVVSPRIEEMQETSSGVDPVTILCESLDNSKSSGLSHFRFSRSHFS